MKGSKMLSMLVVFVLVLSSLIVSNVIAERKVQEDINKHAQWILSNDGFGSLADNLTCGEIITLYITNNSLPKNKNYRVRVWNGTNWSNLTTVGNRQSDMFGDLSISFRVPGWEELGKNPVTENGTGVNDSSGQWNISLFWDNYTGPVFSDLNVTIKIGNLYYLKFYEGTSEINNLVYNKEYSAFQVKIFNWTGTQLVEAKGNATLYKFNITLCNYSGNPGPQLENLGTNKTGGVSDPKGLLIDDKIITDPYKEKTLWIRVNHSDKPSLNSTIALPVLLNVTLPSPPTNVKWGDSFTVSGKVLDGQGTGLKSYKVRVYYPVEGGYDFDEVSTPSTVTTGTYSLPIETGSGKGYSAGTWYVGTYDGSGAGRVNKSNVPPYIDGFIPYYSFEVGSKDTATVTVHSPDDITKGFWHTVNVSVKNESWMTDDEFKNMNIHITGLKGRDATTRSYNRSDIVLLTAPPKGSSDTRCYYEFDYMFEETGTATIWVSWPGNLTAFDYHDSSYSNTYGNHSTTLIANITGKTTISVVPPGAMTVIVNNSPEKVQVEGDFAAGWKNISTAWTNISVYGVNQTTHKNATIKVSGCGLDFTINESDEPGDEYLKEKGWDDKGNGSWYNLSIIPKKAGTLTITVTNGSDTVIKDYTVKGLTGTVTTSIGDDLKITVGTTETITLSGVNQYAQVTVKFFDENWVPIKLLNSSEEAGEFSFIPDADSINKIGYIVVVAGIEVWDLYMYDIIDVVPVDDLQLNIITPTAGNQTLTVGMEQDVIIELLDPNGDPVTKDSPGIECRLIDDDHDWDNCLQEFSFTSIGDGKWEATIHPWTAGQLVIKGFNASDGIKHIGSNTLDVDYAVISYSPEGTTAGIGIENLTVAITAKDANGNPLDVTTLYLHDLLKDKSLEYQKTVTLTNGAGEFVITKVGDNKTHINATLQSSSPDEGNRTLGTFNIEYPDFIVNPSEIYIGYPTQITITAKDYNGNPIKGINLTLYPSTVGVLSGQPDPVETDENGAVVLTVSPQASGKLNVTIARDVKYVGGQLTWTNAVITDTYITVTGIKTMSITVSKSPIYQGETLTVTITYGATPISDVEVTLGTVTVKTGADGIARFTVPDPGVEYVVMKVIARKTGYITATEDITVLKKWAITITGPSEVNTGATFTVTVIAKGSALAGATVTFQGVTKTTDNEGKASFTAPTTEGTYTVTATYENMQSGTLSIVVKAVTPGFELLTLIIALGVAFILLRRRKK